jgi:hypothetical protein
MTLDSGPLIRIDDDQSEGLHTNAVAIFHLYRVEPRGARRIDAEAIADAIMEIDSILSAHVDVDSERLIVLYRQTDGLERIERIVRDYGLSTAPQEAAGMAKLWQEFLRNQEMGDD